jgi:mRNA interferase MazF
VSRGDIVVVASRGAYTSKPRPALVVQADVYTEVHSSITLCPITSDCVDAPLFRVALPPGQRTGLHVPSQVMVDKVVSVPREAVGPVIGTCDLAEMDHVGAALRGWLAL